MAALCLYNTVSVFMALKLTTSQMKLLFGEAQLIDTRFPEKISAERDTPLLHDSAACASDTAYCLRVGAEMPVAAMWTWNHGSWSKCGTLTPPEIAEHMGDGKLVYVRLNERTPATLILSCKALARRSAYCIVAEPPLARAKPQGGIITDENTGIYNCSTGEWTCPQIMARGAAIPYFGTRLTAYRCESVLYELQLADCVDVYLPGQLQLPYSKLIALDHLPPQDFNKLDTFDLLPLRPMITRPLPPLPTMKKIYDLIGLIPLNDSENPTSRAKNMKLYHVLHWVVKNDFKSCYASTSYYLAPGSSVAPHGALVFLGREQEKEGIGTAEQLDNLRRRLMEEELTSAVYLFSHKQGEVQQREGIPITAPCPPCPENPLELLDTLPTRLLYTYHTPWFARPHLNKLADASYKNLSFSLNEYEGIFSPGERI